MQITKMEQQINDLKAASDSDTIASQIVCAGCQHFSNCGKGQQVVAQIKQFHEMDGGQMGASTHALLRDANERSRLCMEASEAEQAFGGTLGDHAKKEQARLQQVLADQAKRYPRKNPRYN